MDLRETHSFESLFVSIRQLPTLKQVEKMVGCKTTRTLCDPPDVMRNPPGVMRSLGLDRPDWSLIDPESSY